MKYIFIFVLSFVCSFANASDYDCTKGVNAFLHAPQRNLVTTYSSEDLPELARPEHFQDGNAKKGDVQATSWDANPTKYNVTPSFYLIENAQILINIFPEKIKKLTKEHQDACITLSNKIVSNIFEKIQKRLEALLKKKDFTNFSQECSFLKEALKDEPQTQEILNQIGRKYLFIVYHDLIQSLKGTPWEFYRDIPISLEIWNKEWAILTGRQSPAAVELDSKRVSLRPYEYTSQELKLFLFHEISHLASPRYDQNSNEIQAWKVTIQYLDFLKILRIPIPELFQNIHRGISLLSVEEWVEILR